MNGYAQESQIVIPKLSNNLNANIKLAYVTLSNLIIIAFKLKYVATDSYSYIHEIDI